MPGEAALEDAGANRTVACCRAVRALAQHTLDRYVVALRRIRAGILGWTLACTRCVCTSTPTTCCSTLAEASNVAEAVAIEALGGQGVEPLGTK